MAKIAVIGGGVFGSTAAIYAARASHEVHLFEEEEDLLQAASGINQYRLHRGYHYPRSFTTVQSALAGESSFREEYGPAIIDGGRHLYAIAKEGSQINGAEYLEFCRRNNLAYKEVSVPEIITPEKVDCVIEAEEARFDPGILRALIRQKLTDAGVILHLNTRAGKETLQSYDRVIVATYARSGVVLSEFAAGTREYQFEICEKPVVRLPDSFGQTDVVIMDGPFMCVDPLGRTGSYVLGNVVHAIHACNIGEQPEVPEHLLPLLNRGLVQNPPDSRFPLFIESGAPYIPILKDAIHLGSFFTIRTVLPKVEHTDERPTVVTNMNDICINIFSGKIGTCVNAAKEAVTLL